MCCVRRPDPAGARKARRRGGRTGQLRHRPRDRAVRRRGGRRRVQVGHRGPRLRRGRHRRCRRFRGTASGRPATPLHCGCGAGGAGGDALDGAAAALRRLEMARGGPGHAGGLLVGMDVPPGSLDEPETRFDHDGHPGVDGNALGLVVVDRGPPRRHRRGTRVLRDRHGDRGADPARKVVRGACQAPLGRCHPGACRPGCPHGTPRGRHRGRPRRPRGGHAVRGPTG